MIYGERKKIIPPQPSDDFYDKALSHERVMDIYSIIITSVIFN